MKTINLGTSGLKVPAMAVGCWRIDRAEKSAAEELLKTALDMGANFFDHADIYSGGKCESIFAELIGMSPSVREKIVLQSKVGIAPGKGYDSSKEHILSAAEGILKRLRTEYLDVLLIHRPDALVEPEEVAEAFALLHNSGKVRNFGVSNHNPWQMKLLQKYAGVPLVVNQLQLSIAHAGMFTWGVHTNMEDDPACDRDGGILDYCRLNDITIQAWSPLQYGMFEGTFLGSPKYPELNAKLTELAGKYGVTDTAVALAWILRHPAHIQPITGTMNPRRLKDCFAALDVNLSREDWYDVWKAAGYSCP